MSTEKKITRNNFPPEHLKWKPGQSGNPKGRQKGTKLLRTRLLELMKTEIYYKDLDGKDAKMLGEDALGIALFAKALQTGDVKAIEMIRNEVEGTIAREADLSESQKTIVMRAMSRLLPDFNKMQDVTIDVT